MGTSLAPRHRRFSLTSQPCLLNPADSAAEHPCPNPSPPSTSSSSPACFIGYYVIWGVTPSLHTPLVALTNAISGIVLVGALLVTGLDEAGWLASGMGFFAVLLASINVFGGFLVTHRMLSMFKKKK